MFSFHFIPEEDRIAITFKEKDIVPVLLTRRLVKLLGNYLRQYVEKHTALPETVSTEDKDDIFQFMHYSELESNPPKWDNKKQKQNLKSAKLVTKVDIKYTDETVQLMFYQGDKHLVSMTLGWKEIHTFLYSLAELSRKADWGLEAVFEWSGQAFALQEMGQKQ